MPFPYLSGIIRTEKVLSVMAVYIGIVLKIFGEYAVDIAVSQRVSFRCGWFKREVIIET